MQQELVAALAKVCLKFNAHRYEQVQEAYRILGRTQVRRGAYSVIAECVPLLSTVVHIV